MNTQITADYFRFYPSFWLFTLLQNSGITPPEITGESIEENLERRPEQFILPLSRGLSLGYSLPSHSLAPFPLYATHPHTESLRHSVQRLPTPTSDPYTETKNSVALLHRLGKREAFGIAQTQTGAREGRRYSSIEAQLKTLILQLREFKTHPELRIYWHLLSAKIAGTLHFITREIKSLDRQTPPQVSPRIHQDQHLFSLLMEEIQANEEDPHNPFKHTLNHPPSVGRQNSSVDSLAQRKVKLLLETITGVKETLTNIQRAADKKSTLHITPMILPLAPDLKMVKFNLATLKKSQMPSQEKKAALRHQAIQGLIPMVFIPDGPLIYGDLFEKQSKENKTVIEQLNAFWIGTTLVTNAQYAAFINEALAIQAVYLKRSGEIYDSNGNLLLRTKESRPHSQLEITTDHAEIVIRPQLGKKDHPVTYVTYYGALAYCIAHNCRLPTVYEWERAGGMLPTQYGQPLQKFLYGNGRDEIAPTNAAYHEGPPGILSMNQTMPVGFFNGKNVYIKAGKRIVTEQAVSPWGCYDISGNAGEWTMSCVDDESTVMITKGGSYQDPIFALRIAAQKPLHAAACNATTGFRVAANGR
jgi:formylglycine-generating enzyme required for sulfatase activity